MTPSVSRLGILHNLLDVRFIRGTTQFTAFIGGTIDRWARIINLNRAGQRGVALLMLSNDVDYRVCHKLIQRQHWISVYQRLSDIGQDVLSK